MTFPTRNSEALQPPVLGALIAAQVSAGSSAALAVSIGGGVTALDIDRAMIRGFVPDAVRTAMLAFLNINQTNAP